MWRELISPHDQIFLVLCGHHHGVATRTDTNAAGHEVLQLLADYQDRGQASLDAGVPLVRGKPVPIGDGWLRVLTFDTAATVPTLRVRTYSPHYKAYADELASYARGTRRTKRPASTTPRSWRRTRSACRSPTSARASARRADTMAAVRACSARARAVALAAAPASARVVEFPMPLDHAFVRQRVVETLFDGAGRDHARISDASQCNEVVLAHPQLSGRDGKLHLVADFDAKLGAPVGNWCLNATRRKGILDAALEARLHPKLPIVEFRVVAIRAARPRRPEALHGCALGMGARAGAPAPRDDQGRPLPAGLRAQDLPAGAVPGSTSRA